LLDCFNGVSIVAWNRPEVPIQCAVNIFQRLLKYNQDTTDHNKIQVKMSIHSEKLPFYIDETFSQRESLMSRALGIGQYVLDIGLVGNILVTQEYAEDRVNKAAFASSIKYIGRYRLPNDLTIELWNYHDVEKQIGNKNIPSSRRINDEEGTPIYIPPNFHLKKARAKSQERLRLVACNEMKVLALSPHPNDIPWGCAGTLMWLKEEFNARIFLHFLTATRAREETGLPQYGPASRGISAALWSAALLGDASPEELLAAYGQQPEEEAIKNIVQIIPRYGQMIHPVYIEGYFLDPVLDKPPLPPGGMFHDSLLDNHVDVLRERLAWLQKEICPDIILLPSLKDIHQDHKVTAEAGLSIFKFQESLWHYELPQAIRNPYNYFTPSVFVNVTRYAKRKTELLSSCFVFDSKRFHFSPVGAEALMHHRAIEAYYEVETDRDTGDIQSPCVEAFETRIFF
jgi:LmbE family N-acetylglucosaminyl deacetylase